MCGFAHHFSSIPVFALVALLGCSQSSESAVGNEAVPGGPVSAVDESERQTPLQTVRIPFVENQGQSDPAVSHYVPTLGGTIFVSRDGELVLSLPAEKAAPGKHVVLRERLIGAKAPELRGLEPTSTRVSSYIGDDPRRWATDLPTFGSLSFGEIYEGISLQLRAFGKSIEKVFTVAPGANPARIEMKVSGSKALSVSDRGELMIETELGAIAYSTPKAYQDIDGNRRDVQVAYRVDGKRYGFAVSEYDRGHPLVIDPLVRTTFLGGTSGDWGFSVAPAPNGATVYVAGYAYSTNFPTTSGVAQESNAGDQDLFVAQFNNSLTELRAATYFGGASREYGGAIAVHPETGKIYMAGMTWSTSLPNVVGFQKNHGGGNQDAFITMLNADLSGPPVTSFLGGSKDDVGIAIAIQAVPELDNYGDVYVAGKTASTDFPQTSGGFQEELLGLGTDVFVSRISGDLLTHYGSTYVGGTLAEELATDAHGTALAVHPVTGGIFVTGFTQSNTMPGFDGAIVGQFDAFLGQLNPELTELVAGTYIMGNDQDMASALAILPADDPLDPEIFIIGRTKSGNFLVDPQPVAFQQTYPGGNFSAFVAGFTSDYLFGYHVMVALTYLGGSGDDRGYGIAADPIADEIWVTGETTSSNFPLSADADQATYAGANDAFVSRLSRDLVTLSYSTYIGGPAQDYGVALAGDPTTGKTFVVGSTSSSELAGTDLYSWDAEGTGGDAFVAAFAGEPLGPPVTWELETVGPGEVAWDLAVDDDGNLHACYFQGNELKYARRDADTKEWSIVSRAVLNPPANPDGDECPMAGSASGWSDCSIAVTSGGSPHICFTAVPSSYTDLERRTQVCYLGPTAGDPEEVSQGSTGMGPLGATAECAIAVDPTGRPTIIYSEYDANAGPGIFRANLAVKPLPDGAWLDMPEIDVPGDNDYYGLHPDIAFNEDSIPLVTFQTALNEASIFVPSFYPPTNESVRPSWSQLEVSAQNGVRLAYLGRAGSLDSFATTAVNSEGALRRGAAHFDFGVEPHDASQVELDSIPALLEFPTGVRDIQVVAVSINLFDAYQDVNADWVTYQGPIRTTSDRVGTIDVEPSFLVSQSRIIPYVTEPIDPDVEDCTLAVGGAEETFYALCTRGTELVLATRFVSSEGVLRISPARWRFDTGMWAGAANATGDWRAFVLSNVGASPIEVTEVRLESETPEDWEVDASCYRRTPAIGTLQPIEVTAVCIRYARATAGRSEAELVIVSTGGTVKSTLIGSRFDADGDGVADEEEWGPDGTDEGFDGNGDGTPDAEQSNVASLHSADGDGYVTIAVTDGGAALEDVTAQPHPTDAGKWRWPWGFYAFRVTGVTGPALVEMFLHEGSTTQLPTDYVKHAPAGPEEDPIYYAFEYDESSGTGATFEGNKISLHFIDGQLGDQDWKENAVIVDPGGPAVEADAGDGCSCRIADRASIVSNVGLGLLLIGLLIARRSRRRI